MADQTNMPRRSYFVGVILLFSAAILWSLGGALIKLIHEDGRGPHAVTIAFYRSLVAGLLLLPLARGRFHTLKRRGKPPAGSSPATPPRASSYVRKRGLVLRPAALSCVMFFALMTVFFVVANTKTEAANVIILQYTSTFWVFGLSPWLLREKPGTGDLWILAVAMTGIAIIFVGNAGTDLVGLIIALAAGLFYALLTLMIRQMRDSDSAAVTVLNNLGSAVLLLPVVLLVGHLSVSSRALILLIVLGVVQFGLPYYLFTLGLVRVPAYQAALITLIEPVLVPVWAYLAVGEHVTMTTAVGGGVILVALCLFLRVAHRSRRQTTAETKR